MLLGKSIPLLNNPPRFSNPDVLANKGEFRLEILSLICLILERSVVLSPVLALLVVVSVL